MIPVKISYEKYRELHKLVEHPILGTELGAFNEMFNCVGRGPITTLGAGVTLLFESKDEAFWFMLKWL